MQRRETGAVDLDEAEAEIRQRWFVWTAAGLTVHPPSRTDDPASATLRLRVSRPVASVDLALHGDGRTEVAVLRPEADAVVQETKQVESVAEFAGLLDEIVELITWSGRPGDNRSAVAPASPGPGTEWVIGYDGNPWSGER